MSTDDVISVVCFVFLRTWGFLGRGEDGRESIAQTPAHLMVVDTFTPYEIATTSAGYAYGIVETAMLWICEYAESHRFVG